MGFLDQYEDEGAAGESSARDGNLTERGRTAGIWALTAIDVLLAVLAVLGLRFLASAQSYLVNESAEFGTELEAAQMGLLILKIVCSVLAGGCLLSALGMVSLTRIGFRVQYVWALLLCVTVVGAVYGLPVLIFIRRGRIRTRYFRDFVPAV